MQTVARGIHNQYGFARVMAGYTNREKAAWDLGCSPRHLQSIETGEILPRIDDVAEMVRKYGTTEPAKFYCKHQCLVHRAIEEHKKAALLN